MGPTSRTAVHPHCKGMQKMLTQPPGIETLAGKERRMSPSVFGWEGGREGRRGREIK